MTEGSTRSLKKIGPGVSEEKSFKYVNGRQTDGWQTMSDHNSSSWAFGSSEFKKFCINYNYKIVIIPSSGKLFLLVYKICFCISFAVSEKKKKFWMSYSQYSSLVFLVAKHYIVSLLSRQKKQDGVVEKRGWASLNREVPIFFFLCLFCLFFSFLFFFFFSLVLCENLWSGIIFVSLMDGWICVFYFSFNSIEKEF